MSWGELSCINFGSCFHHPTLGNCNAQCRWYKDRNRASVGDAYHKARIARLLTMSKVANKSGLSIITISDIENGHREPTIEEAKALSWLFAGSEGVGK